jgi:two-component system KDP operon response regulator KdpE
VARSLDELLALEANEQPQIVLLDEEMPGSIDAVRRLREESQVPIIFMSFINEAVAAQGLRVGADAVLMKPFSGDLLLAQLESATRRLQQPLTKSMPEYVYGDLRIDFGARSVTLAGRRIHLSLREYRLLQVLTMNGGRVLTHDELLRLVWGPGYEESGDLLRGYIRNLRRKIGDDARQPRVIYTESQVGYWVPRSEV